MVKNRPPSRPSVRIQPSCASQLSTAQLSAAGANSSLGLVAEHRARDRSAGTRRRSRRTSAAPRQSCGGALPDAGTDRAATPRGAPGSAARSRSTGIERDEPEAGQPRDERGAAATAAARTRCTGRSTMTPPGLASRASRANDARGSGVWCRTPDGIDDVERPGAQAGPRRSVSTNCTRSTPKRRAAAAPSRSDARVRSAPTTTRSARAR